MFLHLNTTFIVKFVHTVYLINLICVNRKPKMVTTVGQSDIVECRTLWESE
jgi:hypothetical protein